MKGSEDVGFPGGGGGGRPCLQTGSATVCELASRGPTFSLGHVCICCLLSGQLSGLDKVRCPRGNPSSART